MLLDILVISLIIAFIRGGRFRKLAQLEVRRIELILIPFFIQYILVQIGERQIGWFEGWGQYLHLSSYVLLLSGIWCNRHLKEMWIFGIGVLVNFIVIAANGGQMPVSPVALEKAGMIQMLSILQSKSYVIHTVLDSRTKLKILADIIPLPPPYPRPRVVSVGDIIMGAGIFFLIQNYMTEKKTLFI